jgi:hypothetical protein
MQFKKLSILFFFVSVLPIYADESFADFSSKFFKDTAFQKERVIFPAYEAICYYDDTKEKDICKDTIICMKENGWEFMEYANGEKGATHKLYANEIKKSGKITDKSETVIMDFEKSDTDFNLMLILKKVNGKWYLKKQKKWVE